MNDSSANVDPDNDRFAALKQDTAGRIVRLCLKELREILRDRRTMITLVLMPLIIYPLLALVFQRFLFTSLTIEGEKQYVLGFENEQIANQVVGLLTQGDAMCQAEQLEREAASEKPGILRPLAPIIRWTEVPNDQADSVVADGVVDLAVVVAAQHPTPENSADGASPVAAKPLKCELLYRAGSPMSEEVLQFVERRLRLVNERVLFGHLKKLGEDVELPTKIAHRAVDLGDTPPFSLAALLPLILVLMTVTGAVYPAIDLTAGERERGTLETLMAAPVPRFGLLLAKYVAVLTVASLTAIVNLVGMTITARSTGLDAALLGEAGLTPSVVLKVLALLVLFAAFFSAILLALTSCARSFKEAQAYIIPLMLVCLMPGILCLMPGLESSGLLAVTPLVNIVLLARDLLEGDAAPSLAAAAVVSTALYVFGAIALAARIFGTDAILSGGPAAWTGLSRSHRKRLPAVSMSTAMVSLAALFPCYFVLSNTVMRSAAYSVEQKLVLGGLITTLLFGGLPLLAASLSHVDLRQALRLRTPRWTGLIAACLLGLTLWPAAYEIVQCQRWIGIRSLDASQLASVKPLLDEIPRLSPVLIVVTLAVIPGVCEELFFRGFLLTALRAVMTPWKAIAASAVLFGLFHVVTTNVLADWRFLPSTFLGVVLGWVCWRSESVAPCMLLHALHNGLLVMVAHYRDQLAAFGIGAAEQTHLPLTWLAIAGVGTVAGIALVLATTRLPSRQVGIS